MSFLDLATLTMHRRAEMESRINSFDEKCDRAINGIKKLKMQAHSFVSQLNCDPAELKDRFLNFMNKLEEQMYLITDFNLALGQIENIGMPAEYTPVQDSTVLPLQPSFTFNTNNLMDALSERAPSTPCACSNLCPPEKPKRVKVPKEDQVLIEFSSSSTSSESMRSRKLEMVTKETQCSLENAMATLHIEGEEAARLATVPYCLPAQKLLEVDREYRGVITSLAGASFWAITDDSRELVEFMHAITDYYSSNSCPLTIEQARTLNYCAYYDEETNFYYRALNIQEDQVEPGKMSLFLIDTGEIRGSSVECLQPLAPQFFTYPPYGRYCHLAGIDLEMYNDKGIMMQYQTFMNNYLNEPCTFVVDENESESVGVYIILKSGDMLNNILQERGLAVPIDNTSEEKITVCDNKTVEKEPARYTPHSPAPSDTKYSPSDVGRRSTQGPPEIVGTTDNDLDTPEYDDPVEAVTGYHYRDDEDICKHYKGGPEKTCFKGSRCTKKHIVKHPDGWTLDKVEVVGRLKSVPLPAPGTWHKVIVTHVAHFDRVYVKIMEDVKRKEVVPEFGVVLPPTTLSSMVRDMNSAAAKTSYKPLQLTPAPGEIVAAIYPPDNLWYRARVITVTRADQSVEVEYVDYGTVLWVKEDKIRALDPLYAVLPTQAVRCVLAGVHMTSQNSMHWVRAKRALTDIAQDKTVTAHVIARDHDEITVELLNENDESIAELLAAQGVIELRDYSVCEDSHITQRIAVP